MSEVINYQRCVSLVTGSLVACISISVEWPVNCTTEFLEMCLLR